jgi:2-polyprenyl-3-methyl-5-hydroxy-6-metoxy-1,4-benzoquinol methylase
VEKIKRDGMNAPYVFKPIRDYLSKLKVERILDVGCGKGSLLKYLNDFCDNYRLTGIDINQEYLEFARKILPHAQFYVDDMSDSGKTVDDKFDVVISTEVIEHLPDPRELFRFVKDRLVGEGVFIISTPYHGYVKNILISLFNQWDKHHHSYLGRGNHIKFFSKRVIVKILNETGFDVIKFIGTGRLPFLWKSMIIIAKIKRG